MDKSVALKLFNGGGSLSRTIGCSSAAVSKWPDPLPPRIADRVIAACVRRGIDPAPLLESERTEDGYQIKSGMTDKTEALK